MYERCLFGLAIMACGCAEPPPSAASPPAPLNAATTPPVAPLVASAKGPAASSTREGPAAAKPTPPVTPDAIKVPDAAILVLKAKAKGVQIYACGPTPDVSGKFAWSLKTPEAQLSDEQGRILGKHYAGPTWEAEDGSKVVGAMKAKVDAPSAAAIPWLLVKAKSREGQGLLSHIEFVQRVDTEGGQAPSAGCDKDHDKAEVRVDYSAAYYFYALPPSAAPAAIPSFPPPQAASAKPRP